MAYSVRVRRQHPNGEMRRDGRLFSTEPTYLDDLTSGLEKERERGIKSWFVIEEVSDDEVKASSQAQGQGEDAAEALALQNLSAEHLDRLQVGELKSRANVLGIAAQGKKALVAAIFEAEERIRAATATPAMKVVA